MGWIRRTLVPVALLFIVSPVAAQTAVPAPAHVVAVDGSATLSRDDRPEQAIVNMPLVAGDHVRTTDGRVEILFPDGAALDLDQFTEAEFAGDTAIRLNEGRAMFRVPRARYEVVSYTLTTPAASMMAAQSGDYRISYPDSFDSPHLAEFTGWIDTRQVPAMSGSASAPHLPGDLQMYGPVLDQYGGWQYDRAYGYVWYPTVAPAWRPYYDGYWAPIRSYGWTWIGVDAWSWPTHHYGRWGYRHNRWFWIPGRSWAPAWVAWGASPDYVSWCPLGWDSRPVFALSLGYGDPWVGWTVLPRGSFGYSRLYVVHHVVHPRELRLAPAAFAMQAHPPVAVPRAAVAGPGPRAGHPVAVPRAAPAYRADRVTPGTAIPRAAPSGEERPPAPPVHGAAPAAATPAPESPHAVPRTPPNQDSSTRQEPIRPPQAQATPAERRQPAHGSEGKAQPREKAQPKKKG